MPEILRKTLAGVMFVGVLFAMAGCTGSDEAKSEAKAATKAASAPAKSVKVTATKQQLLMGSKTAGQVKVMLKNESKESVSLAGAVVSGFGRTSFGAVKRGSVKPIPGGVTIGAGESVAIDGKKYGLKIMQPYVAHKKGDSVSVTLRFKTNNTAKFDVLVDKEIKKIA